MKHLSLIFAIGIVFSFSCLFYFVPLRTGSQSLRLASSVKEQDEKIRHVVESPVLKEFNGWARDYLDGKFAISDEAFGKMPESIKQFLERPFTSYGDFLVSVVMFHAAQHSSEEMSHDTHISSDGIMGSQVVREVSIKDTKYKAITYGRRLSMTTKLNIPLRGIIANGMVVLEESPVQRLQVSQFTTRNVDLSRLNDGGAVADVGGKLEYFSNPQDLERYERDLIEWETKIGPVRPTTPLRPEELASTWTEGLKKVLFLRVDFPDKPGEPVDFSNQPLTIARAQSLMDTQVSPFYVNSSYNKTSMQTTVTSVVRMPQAESFYFNNSDSLFKDAENAARSSGYEPNNFNLYFIAMGANQGFPYAGIGAVGSRGAATNGEFDLRVAAHELGHNYGLFHSNRWQTTDGTVIGNGNNIEYGDPFDAMGSGNSDARFHFNAQYKRRLDWLTDANVQTVVSDGVYRLFAQDSSTPGGIRALNIRKNSSRDYWIDYRQLFTDNASAMNGAMVRWNYTSGSFPGNIPGTDLLDMTPNTIYDSDEALLIGQSLTDNENRIRMTVLGKGNTTPESLDIKIELGVGCTFNVTQSSGNFSAVGGEGYRMCCAALRFSRMVARGR